MSPVLASVPDQPVVGMIGVGNMGSAIARGFASGAGPIGERLLGTNRSGSLPAGFPGQLVERTVDLIERSDIVILGVKPQQMAALRAPFEEAKKTPSVVVSLAAGLGFAQLRTLCVPASCALVRLMPNVAAEVARSTNGLCAEATAPAAWVDAVERIFESTGSTVRLSSEDQMHAFTALAGSGPAWVCMIAEALADAAVAEGLPRVQAQRIAAAMIAGTGDLLLHEGGSPAVIKDRVTSPAGTTIAGVLALEDNGLRAALGAALRAAAERSRAMSRG